MRVHIVLLAVAGLTACGGDAVPDPKTAPQPPTLSAEPEPEAEAPALKSYLIIEATEEGIEVLVDGKPRGKTPLDLEVEPGYHEITYVSKDGEKTTYTAEVPEGGNRQVFHREVPNSSDAIMGPKK
ncbi:MAG: PEGA domain-containing protein [Myxococcota bacterium]